MNYLKLFLWIASILLFVFIGLFAINCYSLSTCVYPSICKNMFLFYFCCCLCILFLLILFYINYKKIIHS